MVVFEISQKQMEKTATFILPCAFDYPAGGPKVVYEYSNRLIESGWGINIVYQIYKPTIQSFKRKNFLKPAIDYVKILLKKKRGTLSCKNWFNLNHRVAELFLTDITEKNLPKSSIYIATGIQTAKYVRDLQISDSRKFYLIQGYENWGGISDEYILETYHYPLTKFVISKWLKSILDNEKLDGIYLPNGFDFEYFKLRQPIEQRDKYSIAMMYHVSEQKGIRECFEALEIVRKKFPQIKLNMFGAYPLDFHLPEWITYIQKPNREQHNDIYNKSAIFINASRSEGWGLTVGEAMICGCAVACTDNLGFREMVKDKETGLLSPVCDIKSMAENIIYLIENDEQRIEIAKSGYKAIQNFSWDKSYRILEQEFNKIITS